MTQRAPVVVVLGHIDHGKTTLLDYIRKSKVTSFEVGSITQSIGAYQIEYNKQKITFIDTPGHEAFSKMRSHGVNAADLALLIIAGDEGIKSQTIEAIKHIKKAGLPFIVVINKIDKPNADSNKVKQELS
ncbi:MAG: Translation initiation factor IF-2, partial [Parcubacteria group bacterium GW2011_GWA2_31_28]